MPAHTTHPTPRIAATTVELAHSPLLVWHHSSYSQGSDQTCVDVAHHDTGVAVRDSKDPAGPILQFSDLE